MTPSIIPHLIVAQENAAAGQHRFLWIPMTETAFWVAVATTAVAIAGITVAVALARRRAAKRAAERSRDVTGE
ncbi:MAG: hypothetical protein JSU73_11795 [candidate division WOR-3 bacterium]|nr:MAG: hypothetical protein JSU73_11795 [candidate division WOR-3 bacterium]